MEKVGEYPYRFRLIVSDDNMEVIQEYDLETQLEAELWADYLTTHATSEIREIVIRDLVEDEYLREPFTTQIKRWVAEEAVPVPVENLTLGYWVVFAGLVTAAVLVGVWIFMTYYR